MSQPERHNRGLGIVTASTSPARQPKPNDGAKDSTGLLKNGPEEHQTPDSARRLMSPPSTATISGTTRNDQAFDDLEGGRTPLHYSTKEYLSWLHSPSQRSLPPKGQSGRHHDHSDEYAALQGHLCNNSMDFKQSMFQWPANGMLLLSLVSTSLSCLFFLVAAVGPRYGEGIGTNGVLTASTAAFLTSFLAKIIEISFVALVVAYIGQSLARKAYSSEPSEGVSFAEISMRYWAVQPGTMFSHWRAVQHAAISRLGALTLLATIAALLYTSAATALVQPQLKFSLTKTRELQSHVLASFANVLYMREKCKTPITIKVDPTEHLSISCLQLEQASQSYHNYQSWLAHWADMTLSGNGTREQDNRPPGWALLSDNITVTAPWIETRDLQHIGGWVVNNMTMAMPHPGVVSAAVDPANGIMQPNELDGLGIYSIRASVPSPYVNVLCTMGMSADDLDPVMNGTAGSTINGTGTSLDRIFQWGPQYGTKKWPPVFPAHLLPAEYNTIINDTIGLEWGRDAIYVLGRGGSVDQDGIPVEDNFGLCSLRVGLTAACSTVYNASSTGGQLAAHCEDPHDDLRYEVATPEELLYYGNDTLIPDWVNLGSEWAKSVALNDGSVTGNSSNARVWTQLFLSQNSIDWSGRPQLSSAMPSPAEALAVMAGSTLLQSARDAPVVQTPWAYSNNPLLEPGQTQWFNASIRAQQYASGGTADYQKAFLVVLLATFLINAWMLLYLLRHRYWYLDFVDPVNLFPLAMNSPPSVRLRESVCGGSSWRSDHFKQYWKLQTEGGHVYMESPEMGDEESASPRLRRKRAVKDGFQMVARPISGAFERVRSD